MFWVPVAIVRYGVSVIYKIAFYSVIALLLMHMYQRAYPDKDIGIDIDE